ncbi:MAG: hypothetical protein H6546_02960 [Chitinophagales bacterium]|nr:hypothetical protein [Chitinophagales bacterium]
MAGPSKTHKKFIDNLSQRRRPVEATFIAGEDFTTYVAVYLDGNGRVVKFNSTDFLLNRKCFGITAQKTARAGYPVNVVMFGELYMPGAGLLPGIQYFAVDDGLLSTTFPLPGLAVKAGVAVTDSILLVDVDHQEPQGDPMNVSVQDYAIVGDIDGINTSFTTSAQFVPSSFRLYYNGQRLYLSDDYLITGVNSFEMEWAPIAPGKLVAEYIPI